jgi:hypothetical protein
MMKKISRRSLLIAAGIIFLVLIFNSCSSYRGYGVLVWKNENLPFSVGEFLNITSIFSVDNYYEVDYNGTLVQVPMWQVQFFENGDEARLFYNEFKQYVNMYVFTLKYDGLPIRSTSSSTANIVNKLKNGKVAKVIGMGKERVKIDNFNDYWYWVLTEEGFRGYIYGYYLKIIEGTADVEGKVAELVKQDPALERFLNNIWRPTKTKEMIEKGKIDMEYLKKDYALIPKPNENKIILKNEDIDHEYVYTTIKKLSGDTYEFEGTDLKIQIFPSDKVYVSYFHENSYETKEFVLLEKGLEEVAKFETDRRQNILFGFINRGKRLVSNSYGTIDLGDDARFTWRNFSSLKSIIPSGAGSNGTISFSNYLGPLVAGTYTGAITFSFDEYPDRGVTFAFSFTDSGVKFVYAANEFIEKNEIRRLGSSPLVIFFNFTKN